MSLDNVQHSSPLFSRLAWGIGIGFVLLHAASGIFQAHESLVNQASDLVVATADRARAIDELTLGRSDRKQALARISDQSFSISEATAPLLPPQGHRPWHREVLVRTRSATGLDALGFDSDEIQFWFAFYRGEARLQLSIPELVSADQNSSRSGWLVIDVEARPARWQRHTAGFVWTTLLALLILGMVLLATRRFTRLLPAFASAAERLGNQDSSAPLAIEGPRELQRLGLAFNKMQERIVDHERERSSMLGAVSHDLRTLITRLSLRLQTSNETSATQKISADLNSMMLIVDDALAYSRDEVSSEPRVSLELGSLLQTLIDDHNALDGQMSDRENSVAVDVEGLSGETAKVHVVAQPVALQRAVQNLIDNGLKYGKSARVSLWREQLVGSPARDQKIAEVAVIEVADYGPGIPEEDEERVLKPYVRLDASRNRDTGGSGLGLSIVHNVVRRHGGTLRFLRTEDGFKVQMRLLLKGGV